MRIKSEDKHVDAFDYTLSDGGSIPPASTKPTFKIVLIFCPPDLIVFGNIINYISSSWIQ